MLGEPVTSANVRCLWRWDTGWPADTVEFCPLPPHRHLLLCGTYKLVDGQAENVAPEHCQRDGQLHLLDPFQHCLLQSLPTAAILDVKWLPKRFNGEILCAAVEAKGYALVYRLRETGADQPSLHLVTSLQVGGAGRLLLACDWSAAEGATRLVVSDSAGTVSVLELLNNQLEVAWSASCHEYEAWTSGFNHWDNNLIYTGGDDLLFRCYDVRQETATPVLTSRAHEAGVTSVQSDPLVEHVLRTGSYDEHLYTWDTRAMRRPLDRSAAHGGVWRIKRHPGGTDHVLAACMYGGSHVISTGGSTVASFMEHKSITYGADWCRIIEHSEHLRKGRQDNESDGCQGVGADCETQLLTKERSLQSVGNEPDSEGVTLGVAVTCSFYDHLLCLWELFQKEN